MPRLFCKHCGQKMGDYSDLPTLNLTNRQRQLIEALVSGGARYQSSVALADRVYADDPDGGPIHATSVVSVLIHKIRHQLADTGWIVESRHGVGYRLIRRNKETAGA